MKAIIPQKIKNIYHLCQAVLANFIYGFPSKNIKIIGVTGTDGKTTTVQMIARILEEAGKKVAVASTINYRIDGGELENKTKFTTQSSFKLQKFIKAAIEKDCKYLVLEVSSHSLDQYRVWGIEFDTAVITNVTREHFDYHKNMAEYRKAKLKLFEKAKTAIVNLDMENPEEYFSCKSKSKFGFTTISNFQFPISNEFSNINDQIKTIIAEGIKLNANDSRFTVNGYEFKLNLLGKFNVENALAATCVGLSQGMNLEIISKALEKIKGIPGRMEYVPNNKGINIMVDFALTPNALERLYSLIKDIKNNESVKIISVFGACGERDRGKRPITGKIVSRYADYIILTDDEPYHEDPKIIIEEIAAGIKDKTEKETLWKILDRREAIKKALNLARAGDFVVVTGMGAEDTRAIGDQKIPWNDKKVILEELNNM